MSTCFKDYDFGSYIITVAVNFIDIIIIIYVRIVIIVIIIIILALFIYLFYPYFNVIVVAIILSFFTVKVEPCTTCTLNLYKEIL